MAYIALYFSVKKHNDSNPLLKRGGCLFSVDCLFLFRSTGLERTSWVKRSQSLIIPGLTFYNPSHYLTFLWWNQSLVVSVSPGSHLLSVIFIAWRNQHQNFPCWGVASRLEQGKECCSSKRDFLFTLQFCLSWWQCVQILLTCHSVWVLKAGCLQKLTFWFNVNQDQAIPHPLQCMKTGQISFCLAN